MTADNFSPRAFRRSLRHACLTDAEYRVANELCEFAGIGKPVVWPSVPTLAENCCMKDRGVQYTLGRLEAKGVIACVTRSKGGRGQTSRWQLLVKGDTVSDPETVHSHAPFTNPETVHGDDRNGAPARTQTVHGHAPEVVKEGGRRRGGAPPGPALDARAGAPPTKAAADAAPTLPLNHDDALHIETWLEWAANTDLPVERPSRGCPRHPDGNGPPCGACKANRELSERWEEERAGWKEDSRDQRARIKGCPHCNEHGQYTDDEGLWWCEHHGPPSSVSADPPNIRSLVIPEKHPGRKLA